MFAFSNTYAQLGDEFYQRVRPTPVAKPKLLLFNKELAESLGLNEALQDHSALFAGNELPEGCDPIALAYSGHQFSHLNPQLGDGRAHLLGEVIDNDGKRFDIQLKGSGQTRYSRQGDGRCALGPAIREFLMSEAMHALGVPTSRCLAVVATGESVYRDGGKPGAVVTRVAASHIRVGTFQYFAIRGQKESLTKLLDYTINRHFPEIGLGAEDKVLRFLEAVMARQVALIVEWMRVGFIHGVMNTDNTLICGDTIDYGPCAMMGAYHPGTVYSSIDEQGRYAFGNQPSIAIWNITRLAECLLPLINSDEKTAVELVQSLLQEYDGRFETAYFDMHANKLGLVGPVPNSQKLIVDLLTKMKDKQLDFTRTFARLTQSLHNNTLAEEMKTELGPWYEGWRASIDNCDQGSDGAEKRMASNNPVVIPRNHHIEAVLSACEETGRTEAADDFLKVLRSPYRALSETVNYQDLPEDGDRYYRTFCGT
ncbi:MAG: YdiU family protein [Halopseudomonas sp.]